MHHNNSKSIKDSDPHDGETEDSPSAIHLNEGDLRIMLDENPKSHISNIKPKKVKSEIQRVEEYIEKIKDLSKKMRVKGDLHNIFTCHGCNSVFERKYLLVCSMKDCQRYFCFRCANKKFRSSPQEIADLIHENDWMCYSCSNMCNCRICKKIYLDKEDSFPHQLTKFERAKKRANSKNDQKDDESENSEEKSEDSEESEPKPEVKKFGKGKIENKLKPSKSEEKKVNKKQEEKENKQESSKENKKDKIMEPKDKVKEITKEKSNIVVQKGVEEVTKEIKKFITSKEPLKQVPKVGKKLHPKKITSQITKQDRTAKVTEKIKRKANKSDDSDESSDQEPVVEPKKPEPSVEEEKKTTIKDTGLSRNNSGKEPPKPAKIETIKPEKSKEVEKVEEKKFNKPKIKRELKQLLKMNDESHEFAKLMSEESFEMSNSMPLVEENSRNSVQAEPKKVVRRFRAKPDEVCHICKNIYQKEHMYPCTVPGCDKSFCSFCIQSNFIQDFDPKAFKADQFICYVCGKFCKCKECDKSNYHANKRRARRNEMRMGSSRRGRRVRGRRVIEPRRRKFYDTLPDDFVPGNGNENSNTNDRSFNYDDEKNYSYDKDLEDEVDDDDDENDSDVSSLPDVEYKKIISRKKRLRFNNGPTKIVKAAESKRDIDDHKTKTPALTKDILSVLCHPE